MGLDLTINSDTKIKKKGTGIYIRQNSNNVELKVDEIKKYFPNANIENIKEYDYFTNEIWYRHITHNLTKMASNVKIDENVTLYNILWRPEESGFKKVEEKYVKYLLIAIEELKINKDYLIQFNPDNGYGTYDELLDFSIDLYNAIHQLDYLNNNYEIDANI